MHHINLQQQFVEKAISIVERFAMHDEVVSWLWPKGAAACCLPWSTVTRLVCFDQQPFLGQATIAVGHCQVMASMGEALTLISQAKAELATSIRQAASWLGHSRAQSATFAQQQQVCIHVH